MQRKNKNNDFYKGQKNYEFSMAAVSMALIAMIIIFIIYAITQAINNL